MLEGVLRCGQTHSLGDLWHALRRVQEGERGLPPDLYDSIRWFCQVRGGEFGSGHQTGPCYVRARRWQCLLWVNLIMPTFGGHIERRIILRKGVFHGTQTSQAVHA